MDNYVVDNVEENAESFDVEHFGVIVGIVGGLLGIGMLIKDRITSLALKKEREKNALYQEAIKKHQTEINALRNDIEREEYKNRLWEELKSRSEE